MSRINTELARIGKILQNNFRDVKGRADEEMAMIKADIKRGDAEIIMGGFIKPEKGCEVYQKNLEEENLKKERIFLLVKTLPLPQNRDVKVIFQTMEERDNEELLHLLHKKTSKHI